MTTFLALAARASNDLGARRVLADGLEELGWWTGGTIAPSGEASATAGHLHGTSLALALAEPDPFVLLTMLRADPRRAFEALAALRDEGNPSLAGVVVTILADAVEELSTDEELRSDAPLELDPRWRDLLAELSTSSSVSDVRTDAASTVAGLDWLVRKGDDTVQEIELGEAEDFAYPLIFVGVEVGNDDREATLVRHPALVGVPGLVRASHQWGGHACYNTRILGFLARAPESIATALAPRMAEISELAWVTELAREDLASFSRAVSSALPVPPFGWGGEAFVATAPGVSVTALRSLPVVRFRARTRGWEGVTFSAPHRPAQWEEGIFGEREESVLSELERLSLTRVFVAWLWGNSD